MTGVQTCALPISIGNQSITGLGFQPKIIFFLNQPNTVSTSGVHGYMSFGVATSSSNRRVIYWSQADNATPPSLACVQDDTKIIYCTDPPGLTTVNYHADFVSMDADGFTVNITNAPPDVYYVGYLAYGGSDLTNVATGQFQAPTATGNQSVTGVGFQPDAILLFGNGLTAAPPSSSTSLGSYSMGVADGSNEGCATFNSLSYLGNPRAHRQASTSDSWLLLKGYAGVVSEKATFVSMDADGFTLNFTTVNTTGSYIHYIALKGTNDFAVGNFQLNNATGGQTATGVGTRGEGSLFFSHCSNNISIAVTEGAFLIGLARNNNNRFAINTYTEDAIGVNTDTQHRNSNILLYINEKPGGTVGETDMVAFGDGSIALDNENADNAYIFYFLLGNQIPAEEFPTGVSPDQQQAQIFAYGQNNVMARFALSFPTFTIDAQAITQPEATQAIEKWHRRTAIPRFDIQRNQALYPYLGAFTETAIPGDGWTQQAETSDSWTDIPEPATLWTDISEPSTNWTDA